MKATGTDSDKTASGDDRRGTAPSPWFGHPALSGTLFLLWLLLNNTLATGHVVLGALLALLIPRLIAPFWRDRRRICRPGVLLRLSFVVLWDIGVANVTVARLVVSWRRPRPRFMKVPLALTDEFAITVLASIITLTPGTVSTDVSPDRRYLLVHGLDIDDESATVAYIKTRYERPLLEIFEC